MTYRLREDGKQYVVICAGGHGKMGTWISSTEMTRLRLVPKPLPVKPF